MIGCRLAYHVTCPLKSAPHRHWCSRRLPHSHRRGPSTHLRSTSRILFYSSTSTHDVPLRLFTYWQVRNYSTSRRATCLVVKFNRSQGKVFSPLSHFQFASTPVATSAIHRSMSTRNGLVRRFHEHFTFSSLSPFLRLITLSLFWNR